MTDSTEGSRRERVPPIGELRPIVQAAKESDRRWAYRVFRSLSIHVTRALLHTSATPNQVTVASLIVAMFGLVLVAWSGWPAAAGCILLLVYHLLDRVDGELARYQKRYSLLGVYLDNGGHYLTGGGLLVAATYGLAPGSWNPQLVWLVGSLGALGAIMSRVQKHAPFHLFSQYVLERPGLVDTVRHDAGALGRGAVQQSRSRIERGTSRRSFLVVIRDSLLLLSWFPVSTVILLVGFVVDSLSGSTRTAATALLIVSGIQLASYLGVEWANLSGNLGAESRRLLEETDRPIGGRDAP